VLTGGHCLWPVVRPELLFDPPEPRVALTLHGDLTVFQFSFGEAYKNWYDIRRHTKNIVENIFAEICRNLKKSLSKRKPRRDEAWKMRITRTGVTIFQKMGKINRN
jgi:hypothetical protein